MIRIFILTAMVFNMIACAHTMMRGTVAMKTNPKDAHVCLGSNEVKLGDSIEFVENSCRKHAEEDEPNEYDCKLKILGIGKVSRILNNHYSIVTTDGSFKFSEGTMVQKKQ